MPSEEIDKDVKRIVIARLELLPPDKKISIGSFGEFSREEVIKRVEKGDEIGKKMVEIEMYFLRSLKKGILA